MFKVYLNGILTTMKKADTVEDVSSHVQNVPERPPRLGVQNKQQMRLRQEGWICGESPAAVYNLSRSQSELNKNNQG